MANRSHLTFQGNVTRGADIPLAQDGQNGSNQVIVNDATSLSPGDEVLTTGGLVGRVVDIDGDILSIDLGSTTVSLGRAYVVSVMDPRSKAVKEEK